MNMSSYPVIKSWSITSNRRPYQAPELATSSVHDSVYGSDRFKDGASVTTSSIMNMFVEQGAIVVRTRNSTYVLHDGEVDPAYEEKYPDAFNRLVQSINKEE